MGKIYLPSVITGGELLKTKNLSQKIITPEKLVSEMISYFLFVFVNMSIWMF